MSWRQHARICRLPGVDMGAFDHSAEARNRELNTHTPQMEMVKLERFNKFIDALYMWLTKVVGVNLV
jgi:hypothetical protein